MRFARPLLALLGLLAMTITAIAADVQIVASSILRTYADYCDPSSFERLGGQDNWDPDIATSYARVLMTNYLSNCDRFFANEVQPAAMVDEMIASTPQLQVDAPTSLSQYQVVLLGAARRIRDMVALQCTTDTETIPSAVGIAAQLERWAPQLVRANALDYSVGYVSFENLARYAGNIPTDMPLDRNCGYLKQLAGMVAMSMVNHGIALSDQAALTSPATDSNGQSDGGVSQRDFERWANSEPGASSTAPADSPATDGQQQSSTADYVWEPGDPTTNRGGSEEPIDLTSSVSPTDVTTIAKLAGRWGTTPECDQPGGQYVIGQFDLRDPDTLGVGVPRIQAADLSCEIGQFKSFGDASTFSAICWGEGDTWTGMGSIQRTSPTDISLFLFDAAEPIRLTKCERGATLERR
jgi:hypothetical protein